MRVKILIVRTAQHQLDLVKGTQELEQKAKAEKGIGDKIQRFKEQPHHGDHLVAVDDLLGLLIHRHTLIHTPDQRKRSQTLDVIQPIG